jgi:hypothetical protein
MFEKLNIFGEMGAKAPFSSTARSKKIVSQEFPHTRGAR